MRLKKPAVAITAVAMMALAACGGGTTEEGSGPNEQPSKMGEGGDRFKGKDAERTGPLEVPADAQDGGTLTVLTSVAPHTLDPTRAYYTDSTAILDLVTRALTQYVLDPETGDMVLVPDMAEGIGQPNEDNTEWTFTLKEGLKYEDGSEVLPEHVAYAVKRGFALDELPDGPTYHTQFFLDGDTYKGPFQDGEEYAGVEVNGRDITIKMRTPFPEMDYYASFPIFSAIPPEKDTIEEYGNHPLATGPYMFDNYRPGTALSLVRNEHWDPNTDPGRIQAVDGWEFKFAEDTAKIENTIINDNGSAQTTLTYDNVTPAGLKRIQEEDPDRLVTGTSPCTYMWYIDQRRITDKNVRMALGHAFPYEAYWKANGVIRGVTREPSTSILPPGTAGRAEFDPLGNEGHITDPDKARQLLEEAGEVGYEIRFLFSTDDPLSVDAKDEIVKGLEEAGFKPVPVATTTEASRDELNDPNANIDVRSQGWCSDWPSGGSWFPAQWIGSLINDSSVSNPSFLDDEFVNSEVNRILSELSPEQAVTAWGELDKHIMTEIYPAVLLGYSGTAMVRGSLVGGMENDSLRGMPTFKTMYIVAE
jgi:peptide/nickel transport system substrate-binding protein